jgi:uncharacterized protein (TIGR03437 family)
VNVQLPFEVTPNRYAWIMASLHGIPSNAAIIHIVAAAPAVFTSSVAGSATGVVLHADYRPVTSTDPAAGGEVVIIYGTGLGAVSPANTLGAPAPSNPLSRTTGETTATVAGQAAAVQFSGLAPSYAGLYQVNIQLPMGLASGPQPLAISVAGVASKPVTTYIK